VSTEDSKHCLLFILCVLCKCKLQWSPEALPSPRLVNPAPFTTTKITIKKKRGITKTNTELTLASDGCGLLRCRRPPRPGAAVGSCPVPTSPHRRRARAGPPSHLLTSRRLAQREERGGGWSGARVLGTAPGPGHPPVSPPCPPEGAGAGKGRPRVNPREDGDRDLAGGVCTLCTGRFLSPTDMRLPARNGYGAPLHKHRLQL